MILTVFLLTLFVSYSSKGTAIRARYHCPEQTLAHTYYDASMDCEQGRASSCIQTLRVAPHAAGNDGERCNPVPSSS